MVPRDGFELTTYRLRSGCSTAELSGRPGWGPYLTDCPADAKPSGIGNSGAVSIGPGRIGCVAVVGASFDGVRQVSVSKAWQWAHSACHALPPLPQCEQT